MDVVWNVLVDGGCGPIHSDKLVERASEHYEFMPPWFYLIVREVGDLVYYEPFAYGGSAISVYAGQKSKRKDIEKELRAVALALAESEGEVLMMQASQDDRLPSSVGEVDVRQKKSVSDMIGMFRKGFMGFVGVDFGLLGLRVCQCRGDVI
tara:strand:- start:10 stop:462 length:453 start_codon:yes stop_codon:yes gene_type:complete